MAYYQVSTTPRACCFGSFEATLVDDRKTAPRKASKKAMSQRRASLPRAIMQTSLSPPSTLTPYIQPQQVEDAYYYLPAASASTPSIETPEDRAAMAKDIAEILAPTALALKYQDAWSEYQKQEDEHREREEARWNAWKRERQIEEEAVRRVRDRNRRKELRMIEERAMNKLEYDIQTPSTSRSRHRSLSSGYGSKDKLVIVHSDHRRLPHELDEDRGRGGYEFSRRRVRYY